jgi:hypothetical protein
MNLLQKVQTEKAPVPASFGAFFCLFGRLIFSRIVEFGQAIQPLVQFAFLVSDSAPLPDESGCFAALEQFPCASRTAQLVWTNAKIAGGFVVPQPRISVGVFQ